MSVSVGVNGKLAAFVSLQVAVVGATLACVIGASRIGQAIPESDNVFYRLFGLHEFQHFLLLGAFAAVLGLWLAHRGGRAPDAGVELRLPRNELVIIIALAVGLVAVAGSGYVMLSYPLSMDEFNAVFQSRLFASGRVTAPVAAEWERVAPALTPRFVTFRREEMEWLSSYLPIYAAWRALLLRLGVAAITNALLAALTTVLAARVALRLWPGDRVAMWLTVTLLVTSSQFLAMSMSWYSMPAHLLLNTLWLWLYLAGTTSARLALPVVGVAALGLHNPFPHALFVMPFLLRIARSHPRRWAAYTAAAYVAGCAVWASWLAWARPADGTAGPLAVFGLPSAGHLVTQLLSISLVASWQTPLFATGLVLAFLGWRRIGAVERDLIAGVVLSVGFHFLFESSQGHGWGYRYVYGVLGSLVLLAVWGLRQLARSIGDRHLWRLVLVSGMLTFLVQAPLRAWQIRDFVRPFARASEYLANRPTRAVRLRTASLWYGQDLVRNSPDLASPVILSSSSLKVDSVAWLDLRSRLGAELDTVAVAELERLGLTVVRR